MKSMMVTFFEWSVVVLEVLGVSAILLGFASSLVISVVLLQRSKNASRSFTALRRMFASSILLGLEIFVAADLVRTVTSIPTMEDTLILALIVVIRTVLSLSIQIELEGVVPWKRALLNSGAQMFVKSAKS